VNRVNLTEQQRKEREAAEAGKEFSFPTKPKNVGSSGMVKEKVRENFLT
jgi:hypothetical protein